MAHSQYIISNDHDDDDYDVAHSWILIWNKLPNHVSFLEVTFFLFLIFFFQRMLPPPPPYKLLLKGKSGT